MTVVSAGVELTELPIHNLPHGSPMLNQLSHRSVAGALNGNKRGPLECKDKRCIFGNNKDVLYTMDVEETLFLEGAKISFDAVVIVFFSLHLDWPLISCYVTK